eukprot:15218045-Heterocapsa_arctica.AAC.1
MDGRGQRGWVSHSESEPSTARDSTQASNHTAQICQPLYTDGGTWRGWDQGRASSRQGNYSSQEPGTARSCLAPHCPRQPAG